MTLPPAVRAAIPLVIGLAIGGFGVAMFSQSMPGSEGSADERANKLEVELKRTQNRLAALEAADAPGRGRREPFQRATSGRSAVRQTLADGARTIAEDLREGKPVSPEDIFRASKPLLRDLAPLFDRMRVKQQRQMIESLSGEMARKYALTPENRASLQHWFEWKSNEEAQRWSTMLSQDGTRLEDVMRASRDVRPDEGLDAFMQGILPADKFTAFNTERMQERAGRVQQEADMKVQRLDGIVGLDEAQRDQVFGIMARGSRDYDPAMALDGVGGQIGATPAGDKQAAMLSILRPEQRAAYEAARVHRRDEASKDMEAMGLSLPPGWEMLDDN